MSCLEFVGLSDAAGREAGTLPLGRQKVLEIARALATEPRMILLDEPAGGLNMRETEELGELVRLICRRGMTVLLVEHDMSLIMDISHRILVLRYGQVLASGTPDEIKNDPAVIEGLPGGGVALFSQAGSTGRLETPHADGKKHPHLLREHPCAEGRLPAHPLRGNGSHSSGRTARGRAPS